MIKGITTKGVTNIQWSIILLYFQCLFFCNNLKIFFWLELLYWLKEKNNAYEIIHLYLCPINSIFKIYVKSSLLPIKRNHHLSLGLCKSLQRGSFSSFALNLFSTQQLQIFSKIQIRSSHSARNLQQHLTTLRIKSSFLTITYKTRVWPLPVSVPHAYFFFFFHLFLLVGG